MILCTGTSSFSSKNWLSYTLFFWASKPYWITVDVYSVSRAVLSLWHYCFYRCICVTGKSICKTRQILRRNGPFLSNQNAAWMDVSVVLSLDRTAPSHASYVLLALTPPQAGDTSEKCLNIVWGNIRKILIPFKLEWLFNPIWAVKESIKYYVRETMEVINE